LSDYKAGFSAHAISFPNTVKLLKRLQQKKYKLGMISNGYGDFQTRNIQALGIEKYFDVILISELEGIRKPDPAIFIKAADQLKVLPEYCVYVGDHPTNDVIASRNVGMRGIWKEDLYYTNPFVCDGVIRNLLELEGILELCNFK
jgi:putative hydrolase of the HAD superfamily